MRNIMATDAKPWHYSLSKLILFVTFNLGFLIIGSVLYYYEFTNLIEAIADETGEWSKGAITDVTTVRVVNGTKPPCPSGYDIEEGIFQGTRDVCVRPSNFYVLGQCTKRMKTNSFSMKGMPSETFSYMNSHIICSRRSN
jgi:hypothetical protein